MRIRRSKQCAVFLLVSSVAFSVSAFAQDGGAVSVSTSRAQAIADAEREKAKHLTPQEPPRGERKFNHIEKKVIKRTFNPNGPALKFGGIPTGGGFSLGPQYTRQDLLADHLTSNTFIAGSTKKWYGGATSLDFHDLLNGHLQLLADAGYQNSASVWYFGDGPNSSKNNKTDFRREFTTAHFGARTHFFDQKLTVGYTVGGLLVNVGPGSLNNT